MGGNTRAGRFLGCEAPRSYETVGSAVPGTPPWPSVASVFDLTCYGDSSGCSLTVVVTPYPPIKVFLDQGGVGGRCVNAVLLLRDATPKVRRNDRCLCGSRLKCKHCLILLHRCSVCGMFVAWQESGSVQQWTKGFSRKLEDCEWEATTLRCSTRHLARSSPNIAELRLTKATQPMKPSPLTSQTSGATWHHSGGQPDRNEWSAHPG